MSLFSSAIKISVSSGYSVIPVGLDKRPLIKWEKYQSERADDATIESWFEKWPDANIGIVTGKISGITVVDVDTHAGADSSPFPPTYSVKTGNGGLQLYYRYNPGVITCANAYEKFPHVDIRNDGGFVVAPPSRITPTKKGANGKYEIVNDIPLAPFPIHLFGQKRTTHKNRPLASLASLREGEGRNDAIASFTGKIIRGIHPSKWDKEVWPLIVKMNDTHNPPMDEKELRTIYESITAAEFTRLEQESSKDFPSPVEITPEQQQFITLKKLGLSLNQYGNPHKDSENIKKILKNDEKYAGNIRNNVFLREIQYRKDADSAWKPYTDDILISIMIDIQARFMRNVTKNNVHDAFMDVANDVEYDEPTEWLKSLSWDGTSRLEYWLHHTIGAQGIYHEAVGAQWLTAVVRRLVNPGCVWDYTLVFFGPQGVGKTSIFRILGGKWYKAFSGSIEDKDVYIAMRGAAIIDLDEGASLSRHEALRWKGFMTRQLDEYRAPYDRTSKTYPRRFVFGMTTNDDEHLKDTTGNRRFWPVKIENMANFAWLEENRDQLFAEAYHIVTNDLPIPEVPMEEVIERQSMHTSSDPWEDQIVDYIYGFDEYHRGNTDFYVTIMQVYEKAIGGEDSTKVSQRDANRISTILKNALGLERAMKREDGKPRRVYRLNLKKAKQLQESYEDHGPRTDAF